MATSQAIQEFQQDKLGGLLLKFLDIFDIINSQMLYHDAVLNHYAVDFDGRNDCDLGFRFSGFHSLHEFHLPPLDTLFSLREFDALYEPDEVFTLFVRSCPSGSFHIQIISQSRFLSNSLLRKDHLLLVQQSQMDHKVIGMTLKAIFQGMINGWVRTSHFIDQMTFIIFKPQLTYDNSWLYQVLNNFARNIKEFQERTRKAANNTQEAYELADNTDAKLTHYKQVLASILVSIRVIMVHNNFKAGKIVVTGQSNDYHNINAAQNQEIKLIQDSLGQIYSYRNY